MIHSKRVLSKSTSSNFVDGLYVKDGRLINTRPDGISGIQQAANIKRSIKNDRKINQISAGIRLAKEEKKWSF